MSLNLTQIFLMKLCLLLSVPSSKARTSRDHFFQIYIYFFILCVSPDFHELWRSVMNTHLFTEVKQQWATLLLGWVNVSLYYACLMALQLTLVD